MRVVAFMCCVGLLVGSSMVLAVEEGETTPPPTWVETTIDLPASLPTPTQFGRTVAGEFNTFHGTDFAAIQDGVPVVWLDSDVVSTYWVLPVGTGETVSDMGVLPRPDYSHRDRLVTAGSAGLSTWELDYTFSPPVWTRTVIDNSSEWATCTHMGVGLLDNNGHADVYGIDSTGAILVRYDAGDFSTTLNTPALAKVTTSTFTDVELSHAFQNGAPGDGMLLAMTATGIGVYDYNLTPQVFQSLPSPVAMTIISEEGAQDRLAVVTEPTASIQYIAVLNQDWTTTTVLAWSADDIYDVISGYVDPMSFDTTDPVSNDEDLILLRLNATTGNAEKITILLNQGDGVFDLANQSDVTVGGGAISSDGLPTVADIDNNGAGDIVKFDIGEGHGVAFLNRGSDPFSKTPEFSQLLFDLFDPYDAQNPILRDLLLWITLVPASDWDSINTPSYTAKVEIGLYRVQYDDNLKALSWAEGVTLTNPIDLIAVDQTPSGGGAMSPNPIKIDTQTDEIHLDDWESDYLFYVFVRYVLLNGSGDVVKVYKSRSHLMTTATDQDPAGSLQEEIYEYVADLPEANWPERKPIWIEDDDIPPAVYTANGYTTLYMPPIGGDDTVLALTAGAISGGTGVPTNGPIDDFPPETDPGGN